MGLYEQLDLLANEFMSYKDIITIKPNKRGGKFVFAEWLLWLVEKVVGC